MWKLAPPVLIFVCSAFCSQAAGQDFCATMRAVAKEAPRFVKFRGPLNETQDYRSRFMLPGADDCYINRTDPEFVCEWNVASSQVVEQARVFMDAVRACFPGGRFSDRSKVDRPAFHYYVGGLVISIHGRVARADIFLGIAGED